MKLHLPKQLRVALIAAISCVATMPTAGKDLTSENIKSTSNGETYLNVGTASYFPTTHTWRENYDQDSCTYYLTVGNSDTTNGDVDLIGAFNNEAILTPNGKITCTNSLKVNGKVDNVEVRGEVLIQGSGRIVLGGQSSSYHAGLWANKITINGTGNVRHYDVTRTVVDEFYMNSGTAYLNYTGNCRGGNTHKTLEENKRTQIKQKLVVTGGTILLGHLNPQKSTKEQPHIMTAFGTDSSAAEITHSGGRLTIWADTIARTGFTINHNDGAERFLIRDSLFIHGSNGTCNINQTANSKENTENGKLIIGNLTDATALGIEDTKYFKSSVANSTFNFTQSGTGLIHLAYGSHFGDVNNIINFKQQGAGTILIGGGHDIDCSPNQYKTKRLSDFECVNTSYILNQTNTNGLITLKTGAVINAEQVDVQGKLAIESEAGIAAKSLTLYKTSVLSVAGSLVAGTSIPTTLSSDALNVVEGGQLNLGDGYGTQDGAIKDVVMTGGETNYSGKVTLDTMSISGGTLNLNDGTDALSIDTLSVASGGSITLTANSTATSTSAPLTLDTANGWTMEGGSIFNISFTNDYTNSLTSNYYEFTELVATGTVTLDDFNNTFALVDTSSAWKLENAEWEYKDGAVYVKGSIYCPVTEVTDEDSAKENYEDISEDLPLELVVSEDVTLTGDNSHSGGTVIDNVDVVIGHENALGDGAVTTKRDAGLETAEGITANLPSAITIEDGTLSVKGKYTVSDASVVTSGKMQGEAWFDVNGETGNGFYRAASTNAHEIVKGVKDGNLSVDALDDVTIVINDEEYQLYSDGLAGEELDYSTYHIKGEHEVKVTEILAANDTDTATTKVEMEHADGTLIADAGMEVESTAGTLVTTGADTVVSGSLADTTITAEGGEIEASIAGTSSVTATGGTTTLSGDNSYSGGTTVDAAELIVTKDGGLGSGDVVLQGHGTLDLGNKAISNTIYVKGCTLRNGAGFTGDLIVENPLTLANDTSAGSVTLMKNGSLTLDAAHTLTILNGGAITLNDGSVLSVAGSLTLQGATTVVLNGAYEVGTALVTGETALTLGTVTLDYADPTMELERIGNSLVLVSKYKQDKADAMAQGNWGIATASRAFVNTVRGQRNNAGCIANGRGTAWFSLLGASNNLKGGDVSVEGAAVGADMKVGKRSVLGVAFGYTNGDVSPAGLRKVEQDGYYAAVYGEHGLKKLSNDSCLSLDWVAAYGTTESDQGAMEWEQDSLQLNARVNWNKQVSERLGVTAFAGLEYFTSESDTAAGARTGSLQNLRGELGVGARYVAWGTGAVYDAKSGAMLHPGCEKLVLQGELRYFNDMVRSNPVVEMSGIRGMGTNPGRQGVGVEVGATYRFNDRWTGSANYGFDAMEDSQEHRVNVGASYTF